MMDSGGKYFGELAKEKEEEMPRVTRAVVQKKVDMSVASSANVTPPISFFPSPSQSHRQVLTMPANLTETLSNLSQKDSHLDDDDTTTQLPRANLRPQLNNNPVPRASNRKGHLTTFFDDLKIEFDFNNL